MEENKTTYQCPFCGQMVIISVGAEDPREEAIAACTCFGAQRYIRIRRQKEQTRENLEVLIGERVKMRCLQTSSCWRSTPGT